MAIKSFNAESKREKVSGQIRAALEERIWYRLRDCLSKTLTMKSATDTGWCYPDAKMHEMLAGGWLPQHHSEAEDAAIVPYSLSEWADHVQQWNDTLEIYEPSDFFDEESGCGALDLYLIQEIINYAVLSAARFYASARYAGAEQPCLEHCRAEFRRGVRALLCGNMGWTLAAEHGESRDEGVEPRIAEALMLSARLDAGAPMNELYLFAGIQNTNGTLSTRMVDDRYEQPPVSITRENQPAEALRGMDEAMDIVTEELHAAGYFKHAVRMMILRNAKKVDAKSAPFVDFVYSILEKPDNERFLSENREVFNLCVTTLSSLSLTRTESICHDALLRFAETCPKMQTGIEAVSDLFSDFSRRDEFNGRTKAACDNTVALISLCAAFVRTENNEIFLDSFLFEKTSIISKMTDRNCTQTDIFDMANEFITGISKTAARSQILSDQDIELGTYFN